MVDGMIKSPERPRGVPHRSEVGEVVRRQGEVTPKLSEEEQVAGFRGWNERAYVPHRDAPGMVRLEAWVDQGFVFWLASARLPKRV